MQPVTITIKSIGSQYLLEDEKYQYLLDNLNKPLKIKMLWFDDNGCLNHIAIDWPEAEEIITLFKNNNIEGEISHGIELQFG